MKKQLFLLATVAVVFAACNKEVATNDETVVPEDNTGNKVTYTLTARFDDETKVTTTAAGVFAWEGTESIAVWDEESSDFITFTNSVGAPSKFTASLDPGTDYDFTVAYYPSTVVTAGNKTKVTFPYTYTAPEDVQPIMAATITGSDVTFTQLGALVHFSVENIPDIADEILVYSHNSGTKIAGNFTVNFADFSMSGDSNLKDQLYIKGLNSSSTEVYLPVPPGTYKTGIGVHDSDDNKWMIQMGPSSSERTLARNNLINMKPIVLNPKVYFLRNLDGSYWDDDASTLLDGALGSTYATTVKCYGGYDRYFRFDVDYSDYTGGNVIQYGNTTSDVLAGTGGTFVFSADEFAALLPVYGYNSYDISFDFVSGTYSVSATPVNLFVIGINDDWDFDEESGDKMIRVIGDLYCWSGDSTNTGAKIYEEGVSSWGTGTYPSDNIGHSAGDVTFLAKSNNLGGAWKQDEFKKESVVLHGSFDSWGSGLSFTKTAHKGIWMIEDVVFASDAEAKMVIGGDWTGASSEGVTVTDYREYRLATVGLGNNFTIKAGTYDIAYNDNNNYMFFEKK